MDQNHFDALKRALTSVPSRRHLLRGVVGAGFGLEVVRLPQAAAASKKRKNATTKAKPNVFGCLDVGQPCAGVDGKCCSGMCQGKKPKKGKRDKSRCVPHDASTCQAGRHSDSCGGSVDDVCITSTGAADGVCNTTTGNAGYCHASTACFSCATDAQCKPVCGGRAACVTCTACTGTGGTMCASPDAGGCPTSM